MKIILIVNLRLNLDVRKLLLYGFLGLMCYYLLGFFTYFEWKRFGINQEVKHALKQAVPERELTQFHFTLHEIQQLKWVKSHEFVLHGHYYDVVKKTQTKQGFFFQCMSDDQETVLFSQLRSITSFNISHSGENQPVNVWFKFLSEPMEVVHTTIDYSMKEIPQKSSVITSDEGSFFSFVLSTETPPPDFLS